MICQVCGSANAVCRAVPYAFFRHLDFATVRMAGQVGECPECGGLINVMSQEERAKTEACLTSPAYARIRQTDHRRRVPEFQEPVTRSFLQAWLLARQLASRPPRRILDVGCFDGRLLKDLSAVFPNAELVGQDINPHLASRIPARPSIQFRAVPFEAMEGPFDLVCISHALMYIPSLPKFMVHLRRMLALGGTVFVNAPDVLANPCALLMGDQYHYFTPAGMERLFRRHGFQYSRIGNPWFPREVIGLASKGVGGPKPDGGPPSALAKCLPALDAMAMRMNLAGSQQGAYILGTTMNAAFADSVIGGGAVAFLDEDASSGGLFRSKPVLHPADAKKELPIVVPYGESAPQIKRRLSKVHGGQYVCA